VLLSTARQPEPPSVPHGLPEHGVATTPQQFEDHPEPAVNDRPEDGHPELDAARRTLQALDEGEKVGGGDTP
jgi:hypothetical protein